MSSQTPSNTLPTLYESCINAKPEYQPPEPRGMVDFRDLSRTEQAKMSEKFYAQTEIKEYTEKKWKVELHNRDCFLWLWDVLKEATDTIERGKLREKLQEFKTAIERQNNPYEALLVNFKNYGFGVHSQTEWDE